jgi:DNA repair protein RadC
MKQNSNSRTKETLPQLHEVEIIYTRPISLTETAITNSKSAFNLFFEFCDKRTIDYKESFYVLLLTRNNTPLGISRTAIGSTTSVVAGIKEFFHLALKTNACAIILCHNHPSGNLKPSDAFNRITKQVKEGGVGQALHPLA